MKRHGGGSHTACSLLLLVAVFLVISFQCLLRHSSLGGQTLRGTTTAGPAEGVLGHDADATLMELAAVDPAATAVLQAAKKLLEGNMSRAPEEHRDVAVRGLRDWLRRQRFDPGVMSELVDLIKSPIDRHSGRDADGGKYASCAVVGNSGILLTSERGDNIDGHELVIRINNAPAGNAGNARYVGARTGLAFLNSNVMSRWCAGGSRACYCRAYGDAVPILTYMCSGAHFVEHAACNASSSGAAPVIVTDPRLDALCARLVKYYSLRRFVRETGRPADEWGRAHGEGMFHYSSGMQAVVAAAGVCERVSVFGFGKDAAARHHYHTLQKRELELHDYEAEYEFYRDLEARPEGVPFLRESGFRLPPVVFYR
ncbi:hypothetical protein CFC21_024403 [Triticum aestivum]|uniref:Sialyltransferase-like protein 3 n=3 Tax=Triticum TaxID=4564 RepID=A0A9R1EGU0_WHEAT|nr:sialyltransferase-like protein 3 [Triticum dicoccoides]XP_044320139.1 sialyltransferase-like protein 3 [Triticum aestivum]KAF7009919.1 hypothetical protein CFC21_024402 [Triticum aestivum]KAF7009920.1 hypothetical protein CFC21_024403 [Triticum aestivum]VAH49400.1 unnamed protein product [Triticum turgidum subsp. durum]